MIETLDLALELIKWFNNHTRALGLLRQQQQQTDGRVLALIRPAPTRWTAIYLTISHLIEVEKAMRLLTLLHKRQLIACAGREAAQVEKITYLLDHMEKPEFWSQLREYVTVTLCCLVHAGADRHYVTGSVRDHIEPLAIAANATQGDNARLDVVLLTLANLYHTYTTFDESVRTTMHRSLEKRWKKTGKERELYILAVIFNPFLRRTRPFRPNNPRLTPQALWTMFRENYKRMFKIEERLTDPSLKKSFFDYLAGVGCWSDASMDVEEEIQIAKETVSYPILYAYALTLCRAYNRKSPST